MLPTSFVRTALKGQGPKQLLRLAEWGSYETMAHTQWFSSRKVKLAKVRLDLKGRV